MPDDPNERLTADAIAQQSFPTGRRGLSEGEVRSFLQRIAHQIERDQGRESELQSRIASLEGQLAEVQRELDQRTHDAVIGADEGDGDALERLGEETTRVLRSAKDAAQDIRIRAEQNAERVRREAEEASAASSAEQRDRAAQEAAREIEGAKERGREMVNEARAVRERILADLAKRRGALHADIEELKAARERLVEAGTRVKRALAQATEAMAPFDLVAAVRFDPTEEREPLGDVGTLLPDEASVEPESEDGDDADADAATVDAGDDTALEDDGDIDALFARLREGREHAVDEARAELDRDPPADPTADTPLEAPADPGGDDPPPEAAPAAEQEAPTDDEPAEEPGVEDDGSPPEAPAPPEGPHAELLASRDEVLVPLERELSRRAKRVLQDEQNELLDALRRRKGRVEAVDLLPALEAQVDAWSIALASGLAEAYGAGRAQGAPASTRAGRVPQKLVAGIAEGILRPMRDRLAESLTGAGGDVEAATTRIGARYREFRVQMLEPAIGDALAVAYARGVYDAAPDDAMLEWVTPSDAQCPDCSDNALEPTRRGDKFPTGQELPPAHPGCRCTLAILPAR